MGKVISTRSPCFHSRSTRAEFACSRSAFFPAIYEDLCILCPAGNAEEKWERRRARWTYCHSDASAEGILRLFDDVNFGSLQLYMGFAGLYAAATRPPCADVINKFAARI